MRPLPLVLALALPFAIPPEPAAAGGPRFIIAIEGCPTASANVLSVRADDVTIDVVDLGPDATGYRHFEPGDAHLGSITIRARRAPGPAASSELHQWWLEAASGADARRPISVIALKRDGTEARRFTFLDCFPTRWDPGDYSPSSKVASETIVAKIGRVELASAPQGPGGGQTGIGHPRFAVLDDPLTVVGFAVEISDPVTGTASDPDSAWESCTGGSLNIEIADASTGSDQSLHVTELTLRGPLTPGRPPMTQWITEAVAGADSRRSVVVQELAPGRASGEPFTLLDCFPTRYVFPHFGVDPIDPDSDGDGIDDGTILYEEIQIKPIRLDLTGS